VKKPKTLKVRLKKDDLAAMLTAAQAETAARTEYEIAVTRVKLKLLEAAQAKNALAERIAKTYGIDPNGRYVINEKTGVLTTMPPPASRPTPLVR
jgi:hypothetical protein